MATANSRAPRARLLAARNLAKTAAFLGSATAAITALGWFLGGVGPASLALFAGLVLSITLVGFGDRVVLGMTRARELLPAAAPGLAARVEALARRAGVHPVRLALVDDAHQRIFATGRGPGRGTIVVTTGLLAGAPPDRLDALIAHELAHVRHRDTLLQTVVCLVAGFLLELSRLGGVAQRALLFVLAPFASSLVHLLISPRRELAADASAAALTGSAATVAEALLHLDRAAELVDFAASPATGLLYPVELFQPGGLTTLFATHPLLSERLRRLELLDAEAGSSTADDVPGAPAPPDA